MIRADEVPEVNVDIAHQEMVDTLLTEEEQAALYSLDAEVEDAATYRRPGEMFEVSISHEVSDSIVAALKRHWESGGWIVGAFASIGEVKYRLVFGRPHQRQLSAVPSSVVTEALEARLQPALEWNAAESTVIERIAAGKVRTSTPLLVRMPTRARPKQALEVLTKYREMAIEHVAIEVVIDEDDVSCNNTQFLQSLAALDCTVMIGTHKSKIEACNSGRVDDWAVLVLASDDMVPVVRGYDQRILDAFEKHFPMRDGAINYFDGYNRDHNRPGDPITCTLPVIGRYLYEEYGLYNPGYKSIYCDTDMTFLLTAMHRMVFVDELIIEHMHPATGKASNDELYAHNSKHDEPDRLLFEERKARGFDVSLFVPRLSVLICSIPSRRRQLERLVNYLRWQISGAFMSEHLVEICVDASEGGSVGEKRQRLLERALGDYVAFIDDDDWIDSNYIERVLLAVAEAKDCCSLSGVITENGENLKKFYHSMHNTAAYTRDDGSYVRPINHLNAVRRELALKAGFVSRNVGEDAMYAQALMPLLRTEASTGEESLYMYWSTTDSVQRGTVE